MADETHEQRIARWAGRGKSGSRPVHAATVILMRDTDQGIETLMLRRNSKIAFGGMWVFPGGRVDPEDREGIEPDDDLGAARRAATREAREEAGLELDVRALVPFSHWTPPAITPKRFLTWFFLAAAPTGQVVIDHGEIHEHAWMRPAEALRRRNAQEIELAPPTWVSLRRLASWASAEEALRASRESEPDRFETRIAVCESGPIALWQGDAGWPDVDAERSGPRHRLCMFAGEWKYERSE